MTNQEILNQIHRGVIVSCQALPDEPLYGYHFMGHLAFAAKEGGAVGIRANTCEDIVDINPAIPMPPLFMEQVLRFVIGPVKKFIDFQRDLHSHSLSVIIDGNFHLPFLHSDFFGKI